MQTHTLPELVKQLEGRINNNFKMDYYWEIQANLLSLTNKSGEVAYTRFVDSEDCDKLLPIPVCSNITPNTPAPFLSHLRLMLGKFELDLRMQGTIC